MVNFTKQFLGKLQELVMYCTVRDVKSVYYVITALNEEPSVPVCQCFDTVDSATGRSSDLL